MMTDERLKQIETQKLFGAGALFIEELCAEIARLKELKTDDTTYQFLNLKKLVAKQENQILELRAEIATLKLTLSRVLR